MSKTIGLLVKTGLALGLTAATMTASVVPSQAQNGGAIAAGIIGGTALGVIAGSALAAPPPPPPPVYYAPAYAPPPPRCWYEPQQVWNGYAYVVQRVRVCN